MYIGILKIKLNLPANQSLKGKRRIIQSLCGRIHAQNARAHNVAIAEIADQDLWQIATIGIVCISNDSQITQKILAKTLDFIQDWQGEYVLLDHQIEIIHSR